MTYGPGSFQPSSLYHAFFNLLSKIRVILWCQEHVQETYLIPAFAKRPQTPFLPPTRSSRPTRGSAYG